MKIIKYKYLKFGTLTTYDTFLFANIDLKYYYIQYLRIQYL